MILDDPDFFPDGNLLPDPTADMFVLSHPTNKASSQMSPYTSCSGAASSSGNEHFPVQLQLRESSTSASQTPLRGLRGLSSAQKLGPLGINDNMLGEESDVLVDCGIQIDEFGNIKLSEEPQPTPLNEPKLPPWPTSIGVEGASVQQQLQVDEQGGLFMMDEQALPDAEALPCRITRDVEPEREPTERPMRVQHQKRRKVIYADEEIEVSRQVMLEWQTNYLDNCCTRKARSVTVAQAKENARYLTFGLGIGNIGQNLRVPPIIHPLALEFSGNSLYGAYTGCEALDQESKKSLKRSRSVTQSVDDDENGRRARAKLGDDEPQQGRGLEIYDMFDIGEQQSPPEVGRDAQSVLEDHPSSAMPWNNRGSSLMPGSSVPIGGSVQLGREQSSPLVRYGGVQDIIRYSSDADMGGWGLPHGEVPPDDSPSEVMLPPVVSSTEPYYAQMDEKNESQRARGSLNREDKNFLGFIEQTIRENGERRHDEDFERQRKWINFDDVFVPANTKKSTAAQAFYHVLALVTKDQMVVEQDEEGTKPYGSINIGVRLSPSA